MVSCLYHYAMYVCHARCSVPSEDFATYWYDSLHPDAGYAVQRLRVDEPFRVPRLCGISVPTVTKSQEINALMKTMLFRPMSLRRPLREYGDDVRLHEFLSLACPARVNANGLQGGRKGVECVHTRVHIHEFVFFTLAG